MIKISILIILVEVIASCLQYDAPIVLGIISDSTRISRVRIADIIPKYSSPKSLIDSAPTPAEPIVWAIVFSERIAPTGLSTLFLYCFINVAVLFPWFSFIDINESGVESSTASKIEHRKESASAPKKYNNISIIYK